MKTKRVITLSLLMIAVLSLLVSCSGSSSTQTVEKSWYWDHELTGPDSKVATENHTIVLQMEPSGQSTNAKETVLSSKTIPMTYKRTGIFKYCIDEKDPLFVSFTVTDASDKVVASVKEGACVEAKITAGPHNVTVEYNQNKVGNAPKIAFIKPIQPTVAKNKSISSGGVDVNSAGKLAILDPKGKLLTLSPNSKTVDGKDNYYLMSVPMRTVTPDDLLWFQRDTQSNQYNLMSSKGMLGGHPNAKDYPLFVQDKPRNIQDLPYGNCPISVYDDYVQTPIYTYSTDLKGTPMYTLISVDDRSYSGGMFSMKIYLKDPSGNYSYMGLDSSDVICTANKQDISKYNTNLTVWFRYYEDGTKMPALQQGEIALFEKPNYQGKAWVFYGDINEFENIQGLKDIRSIKNSPFSTTEIAIYSQPNYSGDMYLITSTLDDISKTGLTAGIRSLKVISAQDVLKVVLSSQSCKYCNLRGINFNPNNNIGMTMNNIDFSYADLTEAQFGNMNLNNINFSYALMTRGSFFQSNISNTNFSYTNMGALLVRFVQISDSNFSNASMPNSNIVYNTNLIRCDFTNANLDNSNLGVDTNPASNPDLEIRDSKMDNASMKSVKLSYVSFINTSLVNTDMSSQYDPNLDMNKRCQLAAKSIWSDVYPTYIIGGKFDKASLNYLSDESGKRLKLNGAIIYSVGSDYSFVEIFQPSTGGSPGNSRFMELDSVMFVNAVKLSDSNYPGDLSKANFKNAIFGNNLIMDNVQKSCDDMTNLTGCADFSGATITSMDIKSSVLKGVNFQGARLTGTDLTTIGVDASKCPWAGRSANFTDSDLSGANLKKVIARDVNFTRVSMTNTDLTDGDFQRAVFKGSNITYSNLQRANLCYATFNKDDIQQRSSDLTGSYLQNVNLAYSDLSATTMQKVSFHSMTSHKNCIPEQTCTDPNNPATCVCKTSSCASAYGATMTEVNLADSYIAGLDMSNAVLTGATLTGVFAIGTNFSNADLSNKPGGLRTDLGYAFLFGADFTNSKVQNTSFLNAYVDNPVTPPSQKGTAVSYLSTLYTSFRGSTFANKPVCPQYATAGLTVLPTNTDSTMTCPDGSRGPCSGSQWIARMAIDQSKIIVTYGGSTFPAPAGCTGGAYLFW